MILAHANCFLSNVNINNDSKGGFSVLKTFSQLHPSSRTEILPQSLCEDRTSRTNMFLTLFSNKERTLKEFFIFKGFCYSTMMLCVVICC